MPAMLSTSLLVSAQTVHKHCHQRLPGRRNPTILQTLLPTPPHFTAPALHTRSVSPRCVFQEAKMAAQTTKKKDSLLPKTNKAPVQRFQKRFGLRY